MAAFGTFDYGQAIGAGTQNALAQVQFMQQANQLAQQQKEAETAGQLPALRQQAIAGGTPYKNPALDQLAALSPETAKEIQTFLTSATTEQRKAYSDANKMIGQIAFQIDPNDPAAPQRWDAGVDFLANQGIDVSHYKGQYSPQLRDQALAISGLTEKVMSSYGQPQTVMGPEGLELAQFSSYTGAPPKAVEGYAPLPPKKGIKFTTPEGSVVEIGGASEGLSRPTQTKVEQNIIDTGAMVSQLSAIQNKYKPEYQTLGSRWDALKTEISSKLGFEPSAEDQLFLQNFSDYKSEAYQLFTNTLKELSGAAVTQPEAERAKQWLPNPGTGLFDGDSPTTMKSKLDRLMEFNRKALAKYAYIQKYGLSLKSVSVDDMPDIIRKRGKEIEKEFYSQGLRDNELISAVKSVLAEEFGMLSQ